MIQRIVTATEKMVPKTRKKTDGISFASVVVHTVYTPRGKVNPYQPMLKGNR